MILKAYKQSKKLKNKCKVKMLYFKKN